MNARYAAFTPSAALSATHVPRNPARLVHVRMAMFEAEWDGRTIIVEDWQGQDRVNRCDTSIPCMGGEKLASDYRVVILEWELAKRASRFVDADNLYDIFIGHPYRSQDVRLLIASQKLR